MLLLCTQVRSLKPGMEVERLGGGLTTGTHLSPGKYGTCPVINADHSAIYFEHSQHLNLLVIVKFVYYNQTLKQQVEDTKDVCCQITKLQLITNTTQTLGKPKHVYTQVN